MMIRIEDRLWCRKCIYRGRTGHDSDRPWLCEYVLVTGKPRGCKAGEGCEKRVEEKTEK